MFKALIVDDEPKLREVIKTKLNLFFEDQIDIAEAGNIFEAEAEIANFNPQIVYLDIAMPGGTGFDLVTKLNEINFEIIFITGYDEYAIDAIRVSAVDYLLKPVKSDELKNATKKAFERIKNSKEIKKMELLKHNINNIGDQKAKIAIPGGDFYSLVTINTILRCEGWNKYTKIYLKDKDKPIVSSYNIGVFKEMLLNYGFFPSHKSHLININHIDKYHKEGFIELSDGSKVPLARRRKDAFTQTVLPSRFDK